MASRFTVMGRAVITIVVVLFLWAFLFQNLMVGIMGVGLLIYMAYRRMEFHSLLRHLDLVLERKVLEDVIHKDSPFTVAMELRSNEVIKVWLYWLYRLTAYSSPL